MLNIRFNPSKRHPPPFRLHRYFYLLVTFGILLTSCSPWQGSTIPEVNPPSGQFTNSSTESIDYQDPGLWWESLGLAPLDAFMEESLQSNFSLKAARARLEQRLALEESSFAGLFPELNLEASKTKSSSITGTPVNTNINSLSIGLTYEVDLFSRKQSSYNAAEFNLLAALEEFKQQLSNHAIHSVKAWLQIREAEARLQLTLETLIADQANLELVQNSFKLGVVDLSDVLQAKEQKILTEIQINGLKRQIFDFHQNLRILNPNFKNTEALKSFDLLHLTLPKVNTGIPSQLIQRRPDLRKAYLQLKAQDENIAAAVANRYPRLTLSASSGTQSSGSSGLTDSSNVFSSLYVGLAQPLFDWGLRKAEVNHQKAVFQEQLATYQLTMLNAVKEVESLLFQIKNNRQNIQLYQLQTRIGKERLELTKRGFIQGTKRLDQVLLSQNLYFTAKKNLLLSKRRWLEAQIDLYAALGGSWMEHYLKKAKPGAATQPKETP